MSRNSRLENAYSLTIFKISSMGSKFQRIFMSRRKPMKLWYKSLNNRSNKNESTSNRDNTSCKFYYRSHRLWSFTLLNDFVLGASLTPIFQAKCTLSLTYQYYQIPTCQNKILLPNNITFDRLINSLLIAFYDG